ncbi:serine/threonine-protein kinase [Frankia sp. EI5c]|uniref:serine/threonine-protein kinase n=1 Tax=Frankia sp. EI5c TaxID=683316 RepID=UPI0008267FAE|nr:serine/threonine-protein kinase [Frankia sp. EI5c]
MGGEIGHGAFGVVLSGRDRLNREVAIKVVHGVDSHGDGARAEALTLARVEHPHIVRVYDYIRRGDVALIVMELLGGGTLRGRALRGLVTAEVCAVGLATAAALGYAHSQGVLHRDIKPANVLFTDDGRLKVADFGIAREYAGAALQTMTAIGTPRYMAPEQFLAAPLTPATDLYALGVILYELLAGRPPFRAVSTDGQSHEGLRRSHLDEAPQPLLGAPAPLGAVVLRALGKHPDNRYRTARDFSAALARAAADSLGPDWLDRAGLVLDLDDEIRALATGGAAGPVITATTGGPPPVAPAGDSPAAGRLDRTVRVPRPTRTPLPPPQAPPVQWQRPSAPAPRPHGPPPAGQPRSPAGQPPSPAGGPVAGQAALQRVVGEEPRLLVRTGGDTEYHRLGYRTAVVAAGLLGALGLLVALVIALAA